MLYNNPMPAIEVRNLSKTFLTKRKAAGMKASLRSLFRPEVENVEAVRGISFEMEPGELLGFIGPNGAGKSTTIKILTGILFPSGGEARVLGYIPWKQRRDLAYHIGTVFGQRPQLWYHLPAVDTFTLFGKIYEMDDRLARQRIAFLAEAFEIEDLLETPVRKLSLGQRMRCEVAASLLHRPKLLLLDEPSIGLDVVAKQHIRDTIRRMSQLEDVGVLLTSHDAGDLEALCKRVIIVNHGQIVYQDKVSTLKRSFLTSKLVEVRYAEQIPESFHIQGTETLKVARERYGAKLRFDTRQTPVEAVMAQLSAAGTLVDLTVSDPPLEDVIRLIYHQAEAREAEAA
jgi:ABC-2 type transport system ATP-binding protein